MKVFSVEHIEAVESRLNEYASILVPYKRFKKMSKCLICRSAGGSCGSCLFYFDGDHCFGETDPFLCGENLCTKKDQRARYERLLRHVRGNGYDMVDGKLVPVEKAPE